MHINAVNIENRVKNKCGDIFEIKCNNIIVIGTKIA